MQKEKTTVLRKIIFKAQPFSVGRYHNPLLTLANRITARARFRRFKEQVKAEPAKRVIVSEGDSWFNHPLEVDIIDNLCRRYHVLSLDRAGDLLADMYISNQYEKAIEAIRPDVLLLSAGGNDMLGRYFPEMIRPHSEGIPGAAIGRFFTPLYHSRMERIRETLTLLFKSLEATAPSLRVIVHGYDYIVPGSRGKYGRYLGKYLDKKGITNRVDRKAIIRVMIDRFNDILADLARKFPHVIHCDLRNTILPGEWRDEIHPSREGFHKCALKIIECIEGACQPGLTSCLGRTQNTRVRKN